MFGLPSRLPTIRDIRRSVPPGGLLNPSLRQTLPSCPTSLDKPRRKVIIVVRKGPKGR
jgi:hypothetical protein